MFGRNLTLISIAVLGAGVIGFAIARIPVEEPRPGIQWLVDLSQIGLLVGSIFAAVTSLFALLYLRGTLKAAQEGASAQGRAWIEPTFGQVKVSGPFHEYNGRTKAWIIADGYKIKLEAGLKHHGPSPASSIEFTYDVSFEPLSKADFSHLHSRAKAGDFKAGHRSLGSMFPRSRPMAIFDLGNFYTFEFLKDMSTIASPDHPDEVSCRPVFYGAIRYTSPFIEGLRTVTFTVPGPLLVFRQTVEIDNIREVVSSGFTPRIEPN